MKHLLLFFATYILAHSGIGGQTITDTLKNFPEGTPIYAPRYETIGQWGFMLGQNILHRQQFAEKYYIEGEAKIIGIIAHLAGTFAHPNNYVEFNVYNVGQNRLPGQRLTTVERLYSQLDLSGAPYYVPLLAPLTVSDSFFVTFNVLDYIHGGFEGDTLGLYMGEPGCRTEEDLLLFGRNAVQAHNHSKEDWKDFYTQNFSPIATHFAIFPVIETENVTTAIHEKREDLSLMVYPQPASEHLFYTLGSATSNMLRGRISLFNLQGQLVYQSDLNSAAGEPQKIAVDHLPKGIYILNIQGNQRMISRKVTVH